MRGCDISIVTRFAASFGIKNGNGGFFFVYVESDVKRTTLQSLLMPQEISGSPDSNGSHRVSL